MKDSATVYIWGRFYEAVGEMKFPLQVREAAPGELQVVRQISEQEMDLPYGVTLNGRWAEVIDFEEWSGAVTWEPIKYSQR